MSDTPRQSEILLYTTPEGTVRVDVNFEDETFWLTQKRMAEFFEVDLWTVNEHLVNIFRSSELLPEANYPEIPDSSNWMRSSPSTAKAPKSLQGIRGLL